jgi:divalent metal cation (Fe/Co/Zn/Cd) transporter
VGSIAVAIAVMALKYAAFLVTGSVALYSDALESIVNLVTAVAVYILWSGSKIALSSMSGLLDEAADSEIQARIRDAIRRSGDGALEAHDVRTRQAGRAIFIEFHLVVPGSMTVHAAHEICDKLEAALEAEIEGSEVVIHVEPEHKAKDHLSKGAIPL